MHPLSKTTKSRWLSLLILLLPCLIYTQNALPLQVDQIKGKAWLMIAGKSKLELTPNTILTSGMTIQTEKDSSVLLKMENGTLKLIPPLTTLKLMSIPEWEAYRKQDQAADKIFSLTGRKANNAAEKDGEKARLINYQSAFDQADYQKVITMIADKSVNPQHPDDVYAAAVSYFRLGLTGNALPYFQRLLEYDTFEYRSLARAGKYLCLVRLDQGENAQIFYEQQRHDKVFVKLTTLLQ